MQYNLHKTTFLKQFAADYDCNAYSADTYGDSLCASDTPPGNNPSGGLPDTGYDIIIPVALGLALIIAGGILAVKRIVRRVRS